MSDGTTVRLPRLIGLSNALDMMLTARVVTAPEGLQMGLVNRVAPRGTALEAAQALALQIADFPQVAMLSDRQSTYDQGDLPVDDAIDHETALAMEARRSEAQNGAKRFATGAGRHGQLPGSVP